MKLTRRGTITISSELPVKNQKHSKFLMMEKTSDLKIGDFFGQESLMDEVN